MRLHGTLRVPSDKSLTHRSVMLAAVASGASFVGRPLLGEDCLATVSAVRALGASVEISGEGLRVLGGPWSSPAGPIDCGNSGTTMRLLSGLIASRAGVSAVLEGDASLSRRPMGRVAEPLRLMGASLDGDRAPLSIRGAALRGIAHESAVASAQVKSAVLLAGLRAEGETSVTEPSLSRDHSERMLRALGVAVLSETLPDGRARASLRAAELPTFETTVPGDISSAAFPMVAAALFPGSEIRLEGVGLNPSRTGILDVFEQAGVSVSIEDATEALGEPTGTLVVRGPSVLRPFVVEGALVPRLVDELPVLAVLAARAEGTTVIRDAAEMRVKETDRIAVVAAALRRMGAHVEEFPDGMAITGPAKLTRTTVDATGDHRIAMSFFVAGLVAEGGVEIENDHVVATSWPTFYADMGVLCGQ